MAQTSGMAQTGEKEVSSYEMVKGGKLSFKSAAGAASSKIAKKKKKGKGAAESEVDTGVGHAPDGKKSKEYEELFPVETKRFGYSNGQTREQALDEREKRKADRYCK